MKRNEFNIFYDGHGRKLLSGLLSGNKFDEKFTFSNEDYSIILTKFETIYVPSSSDNVNFDQIRCVEYKIVGSNYSKLICEGRITRYFIANTDLYGTKINKIINFYDFPLPTSKRDLYRDIENVKFLMDLDKLKDVYSNLFENYPNRINDIKKALNI